MLIISQYYYIGINVHRDSTVQTLTLQPTVRGGIVIYEDSPLVKAVKLGHVLVVDEADKAPTHVTCILKVSEISLSNYFIFSLFSHSFSFFSMHQFFFR